VGGLLSGPPTISRIAMVFDETDFKEDVQEQPDSWWYRVYFAVIITTMLVILALWAFTHYFSS
jgi:hypothetical protein